MTFPVVAELLSQSFPTSATTHTVNLPATVNDGDLLVILFGSNRNITPPASFTEKLSKDASSSVSTFSAAVKSGVSGDSGTAVDFTLASSWSAVAFVYRITGWVGDVAGVEGAIAAQSLSLPSFSTSWSGEDTLWLGNIVAVDDDATVTGYPSGYINGQGIVSGAGINAGCTLGTAERDDASQSAPAGSYTLSEGEVNTTSVLAIRPSSGPSLTITNPIIPGTTTTFSTSGFVDPLTGVRITDTQGNVKELTLASQTSLSAPAVGDLDYALFGSVTLEVYNATESATATIAFNPPAGFDQIALSAGFATDQESFLYQYGGTPAVPDQFTYDPVSSGTAETLTLQTNGYWTATGYGEWTVYGIDATDGEMQSFPFVWNAPAIPGGSGKMTRRNVTLRALTRRTMTARP